MPENKKGARPTMQDVANLAQVTIGTVSHVINGTAKTTPETAQRVKSAILELNYRPNPHAQALRKPVSKSIAYLVPDITTNFYSSFLSVFSKYAYENGFSVSTFNIQHNPSYELNEIRNIIAKDYDAILLYNGYDDDEGLELIRNSGIPLILLDRYQKGLSHISFDNMNTIQKLVTVLKASGYRNIGYISECILVQNLNDRYVGFITGLQKNGLITDSDNILLHSNPQVGNLNIGYTMMKQRLQSHENLAQVYIASSDLLAFGAMRAIAEAGFRVPEDIAVVGFDDLPMDEFVNPSLTTINQSFSDIAEHSWHMLLKLLENPEQEPLSETLPQYIVPRNSAIIPKEVIRSAEYADFFLKK